MARGGPWMGFFKSIRMSGGSLWNGGIFHTEFHIPFGVPLHLPVQLLVNIFNQKYKIKRYHTTNKLLYIKHFLFFSLT